MVRTPYYRFIVVPMFALTGAFLFFPLTCRPAFSAEATATTLKIGFVDLDGLFEKYNEYQKVNKEFDAYQQLGRDKMMARRFLSLEEWARLDQLENRDAKGEKLKEDELKELANIRKLSDQREGKLHELQGIREPTDDQKKQRQDLESLEKGNISKVQELGKVLAREGNEKFSKLLNDLQQKVRKAISDISESKGLSVVLDKRAILWASNTLDITDEVAKKLNSSS